MNNTPLHPHSDFVEERLRHGSYCHLCPLNKQRKVGCDGPPDAKIIGIAEAPGQKEEEYGRGKFKYGRALVGPTGYYLKTETLAHPDVDLATVQDRPRSQWKDVTELNVFLMNVVMCRPPKNKLNTKEGK